MCGRFTLHSPIDQILSRFSLSKLTFEYVPNYNIAPSQSVFVITDPTPSASFLPWGLTPPWKKDGGNAPIINARLETLDQRKTFKNLINTNRCLIIADGFYEWKKTSTGKLPFYITLKEGGPFAFAGLWTKEPKPACTIVTQKASPFLEHIHHRMPLILNQNQEQLWLDKIPFTKIKNSFNSTQAISMKFHHVSDLVNSPNNNVPKCIESAPKPLSLF